MRKAGATSGDGRACPLPPHATVADLQKGGRHRSPALLTTGHAGMESIEEGFPIIYKPFRPAELGRMVATLLGSGKSD
ncbi:MAG: hypothetical protein JO139_03235 [Alphaproteobacteria bacterium]|nr:hypothetical protein [Alphaproteobacteria bacterium]MBV8334583.1 hypothetical protein [Alphaproteobacteria bacterium]